MELMHRRGNAPACAVDVYEVDLISADADGRRSYYQVGMSISDAGTRDRELRPLRAMADDYLKAVIAYDRFPVDDIDRIRAVALEDWPLEPVLRSLSYDPHI